MKIILSALLAFAAIAGNAQFAPFQASVSETNFSNAFDNSSYNFKSNTSKKLYERNIGMILGWQRGRYDALELGGEAHWRKLSVLNKPHIIGATTNLEYYISQHVIGYKAGLWMKRGRVNLTYGANVSYFNDFHDGSRFGIGPSIGFRLMGFHLINGYNFLTKDKNIEKETALPANTLYVSLRYYFPVENKFVWDRKTMKKKRDKRREREKRKQERLEKRENGEGGLKSLFNFHKNKEETKSKKEKEKESDNNEKKGLKKLFNFGKD